MVALPLLPGIILVCISHLEQNICCLCLVQPAATKAWPQEKAASAENIDLPTRPIQLITLTYVADARDSPPKTCGIHYPSDCGDKASDGCIITAMANYTALFMDPSTDDETRQEALKFVLHFVGDIHQPLHVEDAYRGGNEIHVCFRKSCSKNNLHAVWDEDIIHKLVDIPLAAKEEQKIEAAQNWATKLVGGETDRVAALKAECSDVSQPNTCTLAWAKESNAWVCKYVMKQSIEWLESNDLSLDYYDGAVPIVEKQVTTAGIRLAAWLEAMVAGSQSLASGGNGQKVLGNMEF